MSLNRLLGTWDVTMRHVAMPDPTAGRHHYERVLQGAFVMLQATYDHPELPDATALLSESALHYFDVRGVTRVFELEVDDAGWTMIRRDSDFWQRSSATFRGADEMHGPGANSHDGGVTWEHDYDMSYVRVAAAGRDH